MQDSAFLKHNFNFETKIIQHVAGTPHHIRPPHLSTQTCDTDQTIYTRLLLC